jgi:leucyl-tRNA synthetase
MWNQIGNQNSIHLAEWPKYDQKYIEQNSANIAVQINDRVRGVVEIETGSTKEEVIEKVKENEKIWQQVSNVKDVIFVQDKVINFIL